MMVLQAEGGEDEGGGEQGGKYLGCRGEAGTVGEGFNDGSQNSGWSNREGEDNLFKWGRDQEKKTQRSISNRLSEMLMRHPTGQKKKKKKSSEAWK